MKNQQPKGPVATVPIKTPKGTIRRGDRKPYRKAPNAEVELRIAAVAEAVRAGMTDFQIHDIFCPKYDLSWQQVNVYISRARKYLRARSDVTTEQAKAKCLDKLFQILERGNNKEAIAAETRLAQIFGYNAPTKIAPTDPTGEQEYAGVLKDVPLERLRRIAETEVVVTPLNGNGHTNNGKR